LVTNVTAARKPEMQSQSATFVDLRLRKWLNAELKSTGMYTRNSCRLQKTVQSVEFLVDPKFVLPKTDWPKTAPPDSSLSLAVLAS
jgi:hypothetical protein